MAGDGLQLCAVDASALPAIYQRDSLTELHHALWGAALAGAGGGQGSASAGLLHKFSVVDARCSDVAAKFAALDDKIRRAAGAWRSRALGCMRRHAPVADRRHDQPKTAPTQACPASCWPSMTTRCT